MKRLHRPGSRTQRYKPGRGQATGVWATAVAYRSFKIWNRIRHIAVAPGPAP